MFAGNAEETGSGIFHAAAIQKLSCGESRSGIFENRSSASAFRQILPAFQFLVEEFPFPGGDDPLQTETCADNQMIRIQSGTAIAEFQVRHLADPGRSVAERKQFEIQQKIGDSLTVGAGVHAECSAHGARDAVKPGGSAESVTKGKVQQLTRSVGGSAEQTAVLQKFQGGEIFSASEFQKESMFHRLVGTDDVGASSQRIQMQPGCRGKGDQGIQLAAFKEFHQEKNRSPGSCAAVVFPARGRVDFQTGKCLGERFRQFTSGDRPRQDRRPFLR